MDALDVISLETAKAYLVVDFGDNDETITRLIKTAVDLVERYTDYALYERDVNVNAVGCNTLIYTYPIIIKGVSYEGAVVEYKVTQKTLNQVVTCRAGSVISATVGYNNTYPNDMPPVFIDAALKIIVYLYENRDIYSAQLPADVQMMLNQYRRDATI